MREFVNEKKAEAGEGNIYNLQIYSRCFGVRFNVV